MSKSDEQLTVDQVNALIEMIGNTRQVPIVQACYTKTLHPGDIQWRLLVVWHKRIRGGVIPCGQSIYRWDEEKSRWITV